MKNRVLIPAYLLYTLTYIIVYDILILNAYHPDLSLMGWVLRPAIDMYNLKPLAYIVFLAISFVFLISFRALDKRAKAKELKIAEDKYCEGRDFLYAISILKDTRFSYVLVQNPFIELNSLEYIYHNLRYLRLTLESL